MSLAPVLDVSHRTAEVPYSFRKAVRQLAQFSRLTYQSSPAELF